MNEPAPILRFLGRLHIVIVHFPIALLILAGLVELFRSRLDARRNSSAAFACLAFGALSAVFAAWFGWMYAEFDPPGKSLAKTLFLHRWSGVAVAGVSVLTLLVSLVARKTQAAPMLFLYRLGLVGCFVTVSVTSHLGGTMVHGEGFLTDVFRPDEGGEAPPPRAAAGLTASGADPVPGDSAGPTRGGVPVQRPPVEPGPAATQPLDVATTGGTSGAAVAGTLDYERDIAPIFAISCTDCHGQRKRKGGLRLDRHAAIFAGERELWSVVPGDPEASELLARVTLPSDHEDFMPAKGDPLLPEETEVLRRWIAEGALGPKGRAPGPGQQTPAPATSDAPAATGSATEAAPEKEVVKAPVEAPVAPPPTKKAPAPNAPSEKLLNALRERGATAGPLARDTSDIEVSFGLLGAKAGDADLALLDGLQPWLVALDLSRTAVTDAGLARLADFRRLVRLRLDNTSLGDEALVHVARLGQLEVLNLYGTNVGDAGLARLAELSKLRKVFVWETAVTDAGVEALLAARPGLEVVRGASLPPVEEDEVELHAPCCDSAVAEGKECEHPCCVEARGKDEICPTCGVPVEPDEGKG